MPEIKIPQELIPQDARFGCGPSRMRLEQLQAFATAGAKLMGTSHRQAPIKNLVAEIQNGLLELFGNPSGYEIALGNGGSTAFWDVAAYSLAEGPSQALVHGEFGAKFASALAAPFLDKPEVIQAEAGSRKDLIGRAGIKTYVYPQNETSTGVIAPVKRVAADDGFWILGVGIRKRADAAGAGGTAGALDVVADDAVLGVVREKIGRERGDGRVRGRGEVEPRGRGAAGFDRSVFGIFACS